MMKPTVNAIEIRDGKVVYRRGAAGHWNVLIFGWWPGSHGTPSWRWQPIDRERVPEAVRALAGK